ncbi:hypothetical protein CAP48_15325 [Advenella sp. S44]|nr:hypothetical protein CAP48_15325 [Advenella sp. S44]
MEIEEAALLVTTQSIRCVSLSGCAKCQRGQQHGIVHKGLLRKTKTHGTRPALAPKQSLYSKKQKAPPQKCYPEKRFSKKPILLGQANIQAEQAVPFHGYGLVFLVNAGTDAEPDVGLQRT